MQALKKIILVFTVVGCLFFFFGPEIVPDNFQFQEILEKAKNSDVVIIFNSGGWGNTPLEKAEDFAPIIEGVQQTLEEWGYNSIVIPYNRTKDGFFGRISGAKDLLSSFDFSSKILAEKIDFLSENLPGKKIIVTGLSAGGAFTTKTYEKISEEFKESVLTITAGTPFWVSPPASEKVLWLDNSGRDNLTQGEIKELFFSLIKTPAKWLSARISGENLTLSQTSNKVINHAYDWATTSPEIVSFLAKTVIKEESNIETE